MFVIKEYFFQLKRVFLLFLIIISSAWAAPMNLRIIIPERYISPDVENFVNNRQEPGIFQYVDTKAMGDYFEGPEGIYWFDLAKNKEGNPLRLSQESAMSYCTSFGVRLPSELDYTHLVQFVSGKQGYNSNCGLPNLLGYELWTSSLFDPAPYEESTLNNELRVNGLIFDGTLGKFVIHQVIEKKNFRCVFNKD